LVAFLFLWRGETTLLTSGLLGALLFGYVSWALGGWRWLVPGFLLLTAYPFLSPKTEINSRRMHDIHAVLSVTGASLLWLFLAYTLDLPEFYYLYVLAFAAQLGVIGVARLCYDYPKMSRPLLLVRCTLVAWVIEFVPFIWLNGATVRVWILAAVGLVGVALATVAFYLLQPNVDDCPHDRPRWLRQGLAPFGATLLGLAALYVLAP
jgi:phytol kinase